jgi:hypothetical protein
MRQDTPSKSSQHLSSEDGYDCTVFGVSNLGYPAAIKGLVKAPCAPFFGL